MSLLLAVVLGALQARPDFAFVGVHVVPMDSSRVLYGQTVLVSNGLIVAMGPQRKIAVPPDTPSLNGKNELYLMPGLADMHTHLYYTGDLLSYVANGVTTVRNMRGRPIHLEWREKVERGELPGPTVFTAGPTIGGPQEDFTKVSTPEEGVAEVRRIKQIGYDFVKVYDGVPKAALQGIIREAHGLGMQVAGHSNDEAGLLGTLDLKIDSIEHAEQFVYDHFDRELDSTKIPFLALHVKRSGVYVCPTLGIIDNFIKQVEDRPGLMSRPEIRYANPEVLRYWSTLKKDSSGPNRLIYWFQAAIVRELAARDVPLLAGTDTHAIGFMPGFSLHRELAYMQEAGVSTFKALESATSNPGRFLRKPIGLVKVGYTADLLLLRKNPLESLSALKSRVGVMTRGRWYTQETLDQKMEDLVAGYKRKTPDRKIAFVLLLKDSWYEQSSPVPGQ